MCTVQVLVPGLLMRSTNVNIVRANPPRNLCRRLFADEDDQARRSSIKNVQNEAFETLNNKNMEKWNFDFQTETPLPGRYHWVPVPSGNGSAERVPSTNFESLVKESTSQTVKSAKSPKQTVNMKKTAIQSKITDFINKRKRRVDEDSPKLKYQRLDAVGRLKSIDDQ